MNVTKHFLIAAVLQLASFALTFLLALW